MNRVSCIIPAYNEGARIHGVLEVACSHPLLDEVFVVDDGSIDNTREVIKKFKKARLIEHKKNQGKSKAIRTGILEAKNDIIFLLDADLVGLEPKDITEIVSPIISDLADVSISMRKNSPWVDRMIGIDFISGERVFKKVLIEKHLDEVNGLPRFGFEVFFNRIIIKNRYRIKIIYWRDVVSPWKYKKTGLISGIKGDLLMFRDILKVVSFFEVVYQFIQMIRLKVS